MEIKWTAGPGPAPMPYSKRARDAMGYSDDDKPWAHPDPPVMQSMGLGDLQQNSQFRIYLAIIVVLLAIAAWVYFRRNNGTARPIMDSTPSRATPAGSAAVNDRTGQVSQEQMRRAREARLKRFKDQQGSFADAMREGADGLSQDQGSAAASPSNGVGEAAPSTGLRHRGGNN